MKNETLLMGVAMLETLWETQKKDLIDLISPLINYVVAKTTAEGEIVDIYKVTQMMQDDFAYDSLPVAVVRKAIMRDKEHFKKKNKNIVLIKALDNEFEKIESKKKECQQLIGNIGKSLYEYLLSHCTRSKIKSQEQVFGFFQAYMKQYGISVGFEELDYMDVSINQSEINYYISDYIYSVKNSEERKYAEIINIVKGYFLQSAMYLQAENPDIMTATYKNVAFYYDTPFLLNLLGYQSESEHEAAYALHNMLKEEGASFYYFPQTEVELDNILNAYQRSLVMNVRSRRTLDGLNKKKYTYSGVGRLKSTFKDKLKNEYGVERCELPHYKTNAEQCVDQDSIDISDQDIYDYIKKHIKYYPHSSLKADIESALAIHMLRDGHTATQIEKCEHIFVTTNTDFTRRFNDYYRKNIKNDIIMPVITSIDLAAFSWVKSATSHASIPETQLLTYAYMTMELPPNVFDKCQDVLAQIESEGNITEEEVRSIVSDRVLQRELWRKTFPDPDEIDNAYIDKLRELHKTRIINDERKQQEREIKDRIIKQAKSYASEKKGWLYLILKHSILIAEILICIVCGIGIVLSTSFKYFYIIIPFFLISALSLIDTVILKGKFILRWIEKLCNKYESAVYDKKLEEYEMLYLENQ